MGGGSVAFALLGLALAGTPAVDRDRIDADIRVLCGEKAPGPGAESILSRYIHHPDHDRARAWLVERFSEIDGLTVHEETFRHEGSEVANVYADLRGQQGAPWIVVGAHYDSIASFTDDWKPLVHPAPGADDDASGVSVVLEVARQMAGRRYRKNVRFMLFDAEEQGLQGAWVHADRLAAEGVDVALMYQLDPVGYNPGDWLFFTFDPRWPETRDHLLGTAAAADTWLDVVGFDRHEPAIGGDDRSDQFAFWENGFPALHIGTFPQPPVYHTVDDTFDVVDIAFTTEVARVVALDVMVQAEPLEASGCGCRVTPHRQLLLRWASGWAMLLAILAARRRSVKRRHDHAPASGRCR